MESKQLEEFDQVKRRMLDFFEGDDRDAYFFEQGWKASEESVYAETDERIEAAEQEAADRSNECGRMRDDRDAALRDAERLSLGIARMIKSLQKLTEKKGG